MKNCVNATCSNREAENLEFSFWYSSPFSNFSDLILSFAFFPSLGSAGLLEDIHFTVNMRKRERERERDLCYLYTQMTQHPTVYKPRYIANRCNRKKIRILIKVGIIDLWYSYTSEIVVLTCCLMNGFV